MEVFPIKTGPETPARFAQRFDDVHEGTDIFAPAGAQVLAVADGRVRHATEPKGGKVVYLQEPNGTRYYYAPTTEATPTHRAGTCIAALAFTLHGWRS